MVIDLNIIKLLRLGKPAVNKEIKHIYNEVKPSFTLLMQKQFGSLTPQDIEELFDDAILAFYNNASHGKIKELTCSISTYIYRIGRNKAIDKLRKEQSITKVDIPIENIYSLADTYWNNDNDLETKYLIVEKVVRLIGEPCRKLLNLFFFHQMPMKIIANQLGYANANVVKDKKRKCIAKVRAFAYEKLKEMD